jgi:hypothetical protein
MTEFMGNPPVVQQRLVVRRAEPEQIEEFARDFSEFLREVQQREIGAENVYRLDLLLDQFQDLMQDMRRASADIRQLLNQAA